MNSTPPSLLERMRRPTDQEAWNRFVQLYSPLLYRWARRMGLAGQDADDFLQEVFTLLVRKLPEFQYDPRKRFRNWLWTVALNKFREHQRSRPVPQHQAGEEVLAQLPAQDDEAIGEVEYREYLVRRALELMQAEFNPTTWKAFWECVTANRPAAEVGGELGLTVDAVYAAKSRVLRRLREELEGLLD